MKRLALTTTALIAGAALALPAQADPRNWNDRSYDYARVINVRPITRTVHVDAPREVCYGAGPRTHRSAAPEIFGAIVGAAIGNQFGKGKGRKLATVAGAALGGSIAHDAKSRRGGYRSQPYCETSYGDYSEARIVGYNVKYRYRGYTYRVRMDRDPGEFVRVRFSGQLAAY